MPEFYIRQETKLGPEEYFAEPVIYSGSHVPTLLLFERTDTESARQLLRDIEPALPDELYAHLSPGFNDELAGRTCSPADRHLKMVLNEPGALDAFTVEDTVALTPDDRAEIETFYEHAYPGHWFMPR